MFNRITIHYTSPSPMTGVMRYEIDGETVDDVFHLEQTKYQALVHWIQGAKEGRLASKFRLISLTAPRGMSPDAHIYILSADTGKVE